MAAPVALDQAVLDSLGQRIEQDLAGATTVGLIYLGDRLGLFTALRDGGPATSTELAARSGLVERYVREWLAGMAASRYLDYDPATKRFTLTAEQAACFAEPECITFSSPTAQLIVKMLEQADGVADAFRQGGGVPYGAYDRAIMEGLERGSLPAFRSTLVQEWLPALPGAVEMLQAGGAMLDVGCGAGHACLSVAGAFPHARVTGIDPHEPSIVRARANAAAAGLADRVQLAARRVEDLPPGQFDLVTTFDVIHDMADPLGALRGIRRLLRPGGVYLMQDPNVADALEDNINTRARFLYGVSVFYCMTVSLAQGGAGLGTCMGEAKARELATAAGFASFKRLPIDNPWSAFFELRP